MAITFSEEKKSINFLTPALVLIFVLVIVFFIWRGFFSGPKKLSPMTAVKPPEIKINFEIFKNPILKELQPFEEIKPTEETIGRENPFLPYVK